VQLVAPEVKGFVVAAVEIDHRPPFAYFLESAVKRRIIKDLKATLASLKASRAVDDATLLKATIIPPGRGVYLKKRPDAHVARYDVAIVFELPSLDGATQFFKGPAFDNICRKMSGGVRPLYRMVGENIRRIGPVDHHRQGVFLINYFLAANQAQNLAVWEYTAGWFQDETAGQFHSAEANGASRRPVHDRKSLPMGWAA
jgi:hypothetical protein